MNPTKFDNQSLASQNLEAEEALLGTILLNQVPEALDRAAAILAPDAMASPAHQIIWRACLDLHAAGKDVDLMSVCSWLHSHHQLEAAGGQALLANLVDCPWIIGESFQSCIDLILHHYKNRRMAAVGREVYAMAADSTDFTEKSSKAIQKLEKLLELEGESEQSVEKRQIVAELAAYNAERLDLGSVFHPYIAKALKAAADSLPCPVEYLVQPFASIAAGLIGTKATVAIKPTWKEPCIVWTGVIGDAGSMKSPGLNVVKRPLVALQASVQQEFEAAISEYDQALTKWEALDKEARAQNPKPEKPSVRDYYMGRWTTEALLEAHAQEKNATGFVAVKDELAGLFTGMGQYKGGKGDDRQIFLDLWNGADDKVDRIGKKSFLSRTCISITGGIQEKILLRTMKDPDDPDGMWGRFLWSKPPHLPDYWTDGETDITPFLATLYRHLDTLPSDTLYTLDPEARDLYKHWVNYLADEKSNSTDAMRNALSKLKGYMARLALVIHCLDLAADPSLPFTTTINASTIERAIAWASYYLNQARLLNSKSQPDVPSELVDIANLSKEQGWISHRALQLKHWAKTAEEAKAKLQELARMGLGTLKREGRNLFWKFVENCDMVSHLSNATPEPTVSDSVDFLETAPVATSSLAEPVEVAVELEEKNTPPSNFQVSTKSFTVLAGQGFEDCDTISHFSTNDELKVGDRVRVKSGWGKNSGRAAVVIGAWMARQKDSLGTRTFNECNVRFEDGSTWKQAAEAFESAGTQGD
ncbi:DUF3987 domain-containing protein [Coleofasciculus sp. FACHB-T130]|uniref:DUF3987 domain-containing protein n=1 Tax=Cyanophyceae TaxID=3028117 RepID=UPI001687EF5A|nr:DUF3987 domain-containing protein [Coleofasciculus sp. FACHB-T130]MBD1878372.1 DUF3987 domain-containing protein [Coleofasciculus sp. FACHB-T130]